MDEKPSRFHEVEQRAGELEARATASVRRSPWRFALYGLVAAGFAVFGIALGTCHLAHRAAGVTLRQPAVPTLATPQSPEAPNAALAPEAPNAPPAPEAPNAPPARPGPTVGVTLPGGSTLDVAPNSPEGRLAHSLADAAVPLPRAFPFDELAFSSGTSVLDPSASNTLDHVATTLNAYPSARLRIEGYGQRGGARSVHRALAETRARVIRDELVSRGVAANRIRTTGRGASAASERQTVIVLLRR
jgi:outer membrane protein OmpA-like peptidoglycan-associated protein